MDVLFQLLVPELPQIENLVRHQRVFNWGGVDYPQEPISYKWGEHVELVLSALQPHIPELLPEGYFDEDWLVFDVADEGIELWGSELNQREVKWSGHRLDDLLRLILNQSERWVVIFELHFDQIDSVYALSPDECVEKLESNLRWIQSPEGFICIKSAT